MTLGDLVSNHGETVHISVPAKFQARLGQKAKGQVLGIRRRGRVLKVDVRVKGRTYEFRPQDLSAA
jgi:hypothetical protein